MTERSAPTKEHALKHQGDGETMPRNQLEVLGDPARNLQRMGAMAIFRGRLMNIFPPAYRGGGGALTTSHAKRWPEGDVDFSGNTADMDISYSRIGWENEFSAVQGETGEPAPVSAEQKDILSRLAVERGFSMSDELMTYSVELGTLETARSLSEIEWAQDDFLKFILATTRLSEHSAYPGSSLPGADFDRSYLSHNAHVQRMIRSVLGIDRVEMFTAISSQLNVEIPSPLHGAKAALQTVPSITSIEIIGQSSPASGPTRKFSGAELITEDGRTDAEKDRFLLKEVGGLEPGNWHATRQPQREIGLGTGGVIKNLPPLEALKDQESYLDWLAEVTKYELADRQLGGHTVRVRSHEPTGAIELPDPDNAGLRMERLMAMYELQLKVTRLAMDPMMQTPEMMRFVTDNYADVFLPLTDDKPVRDIIESERVNRLRTAKYGKRAELYYPDGRSQPASTTLLRLIEFLSVMGTPVSHKTRQEVMLGLQTLPSDCASPFETYYREGIGTFSEAWQAEYERMIEPNEQKRMQQLNTVAAKVFLSYAERRVRE